MKNNRILSLFLVLTALSLTFSSNFVSGATREATISTFAEKDTYIDLYSPSSNYGGASWLIFGYHILDFTETYLFFDFSDKPSNWTKAEISIDMYSISETFDVTVSLINDSWSETGMTWINKPEHRGVIAIFSVSSSTIYKIDVTDYIDGKDNISICINASDYFQSGYVQASSREGYYFDEDAPQLIWTYEETVEITVTNPDSSDIWMEDEHTITWDTVGYIERVKIELYQGSEFIEELTILGYTDNDGEYDWTIYSWDDYIGTNYRIKISDYYDDTVYDFSDYFKINDNGDEKSISITSPTTDSIWETGTNIIYFSTTGIINRISILLYKGAVFVKTLHTGTFDLEPIHTGEYNWQYEWSILDSDNLDGDDYRVYIEDFDDDTVYGISDYFEITTTSPDNDGGVSANIDGYSLPILTVFGIGGLLVIIIAELRKFKIKN